MLYLLQCVKITTVYLLPEFYIESSESLRAKLPPRTVGNEVRVNKLCV